MEVHTPQSLEEKSTWGECPIEASALLWATESGHNLSQINTVLEELEAEGTHGNRKHKGTLKGFPQCEDADLINFFASRKPIRSPVTGTGFKTVASEEFDSRKDIENGFCMQSPLHKKQHLGWPTSTSHALPNIISPYRRKNRRDKNIGRFC